MALFMQGVVAEGAAIGMWMDAHGAGRMAAGHCAAHGASTPQDQSSGHASHDHDHCLLCNTAVADSPAPALPLLAAALDESAAPAAAPERVAYRKVGYANAPRGPPHAA